MSTGWRGSWWGSLVYTCLQKPPWWWYPWAAASPLMPLFTAHCPTPYCPGFLKWCIMDPVTRSHRHLTLTQPPLSEDTGRQILSLTVHICSSHSNWGVEEFLTPLDEFRGSNIAVLLLASVTQCSSELLVAVSLGCHIFVHLAWWSWCLLPFQKMIHTKILFVWEPSTPSPQKNSLSWVT